MSEHADIDSHVPATHADWLEVAVEDRHPYGFEACPYQDVAAVHAREPVPEIEAAREAWGPQWPAHLSLTDIETEPEAGQ